MEQMSIGDVRAHSVGSVTLDVQRLGIAAYRVSVRVDSATGAMRGEEIDGASYETLEEAHREYCRMYRAYLRFGTPAALAGLREDLMDSIYRNEHRVSAEAHNRAVRDHKLLISVQSLADRCQDAHMIAGINKILDGTR